MSFRSAGIIAVGVMLTAVGVAHASGEQAQVRFPSGAFAINPTTCKFLHREVDKPLGNSWTTGRVAFAYEDGRHDTLDNCLRHKLNSEQPPTTPPPSTDTCWQQAGEVPRNSGIELRNYLDKLQDCETKEVEGSTAS